MLSLLCAIVSLLCILAAFHWSVKGEYVIALMYSIAAVTNFIASVVNA